METQNIIDDLNKDRRKIREQIKELEADLHAIGRVIRRYSQNGAPPPSSPSADGNPSFKLKEAGKHFENSAVLHDQWLNTEKVSIDWLSP